jgi:hypothetical protein
MYSCNEDTWYFTLVSQLLANYPQLMQACFIYTHIFSSVERVIFISQWIFVVMQTQTLQKFSLCGKFLLCTLKVWIHLIRVNLCQLDYLFLIIPKLLRPYSHSVSDINSHCHCGFTLPSLQIFKHDFIVNLLSEYCLKLKFWEFFLFVITKCQSA